MVEAVQAQSSCLRDLADTKLDLYDNQYMKYNDSNVNPAHTYKHGRNLACSRTSAWIMMNCREMCSLGRVASD